MSGRSRGRANPNQDADEERRLWKEIDEKARGVDALVSRSNEIGEEIIEVETQQAVFIAAGKLSDASLDERLEKLYRENVKISEEVNHIIEGKSNEMNLLDSINILAGLREASEESAAQHLSTSHSNTGRTASGKLSRGGPNKKGSGSANLKSSTSSNSAAVAPSTEADRDEPSAAPSPRIIIGGPGRLSAAKEKSSRSGSIATTREASVKIEDGAESVASSADGVSSHTPASTNKSSSVAASAAAANNARGANRLVLKLGEIVFCRHIDKKDETIEGEGILCRVTNVIGEGKQRRYEVQDADTSGDPPPPQRASVAQLIQIPHSNVGLGDLPKGRHVIAQYPDTTTFYKAEVNEAWKARESENKDHMVRLNFQEDEEAREVERRFVLNER